MKEFEALVERTHKQGWKVLIDLVPNHLARQYVSDAAREGVVDFGAGDRRDLAFHKDNTFYYLPGARFDSPEAEERGERWEEEPARATGNDCFKANPGQSEEHTSELQSRPHLVCRLLLEKKKQYTLSQL